MNILQSRLSIRAIFMIDVLVAVASTYVALVISNYYSFFHMISKLPRLIILMSLIMSVIWGRGAKLHKDSAREFNFRVGRKLLEFSIFKVGFIVLFLFVFSMIVRVKLMSSSQMFIFALVDMLLSFFGLVLLRMVCWRSKGEACRQAVRELKIEDLLDRKLIEIDKSEVCESFRGKTVLVTGAAGSIGAELCRQLISLGIKRLIMCDSAETPIHRLKMELVESCTDVEFIPIIADVRMKVRLRSIFKNYRPDLVFHAAAYKHVPLMENNPSEAVILNVLGSKNVADLCLEYGVEKMVMISSDKAVNPTNVMGASKRIAEIYVQSLGVAIERGVVIGNTKFITTRFGNVLGSNGSVVPLFQEQIAKGGPITVTHPDITRYFMTIPEACKLVMKAASMGEGNEIFVFDMGKPVKIVELANKMIELSGLVPNQDVKISYIGLRPGEKLYEELLSDKESTIPTSHEKILIAKVRECDYGDMSAKIRKLIRLAFLSENEETIVMMKQIVPEYLSAESKYMKYD